MTMRLEDLERNDVEAALSYWREHRDRPSSDGLRFEMLLMLQDDPSELIAAMQAEEATG
jgi:hypothetical protein